MKKADIVRKLYEVADFNLLGAGTWPAQREFSAAFQRTLRDLGLEEDVPGMPRATRSTALGRELNVDLMMVFAGVWDPSEIPNILESNGYLEEAEVEAVFALNSGIEAERLV